jgi:hypothetical protein
MPYFTLPCLTFFSLPSLQTRPLNRFARTISQTTRIAPRKCLLGVSSMKNFFTGEYPFPKIFKGHFTCKSKKSNNFEQLKDNRKIPKPTYTKSGTRNRMVTSRSGLARPLAAEIVFLPFSAITKALITSKRYKIDGKCL